MDDDTEGHVRTAEGDEDGPGNEALHRRPRGCRSAAKKTAIAASTGRRLLGAPSLAAFSTVGMRGAALIAERADLYFPQLPQFLPFLGHGVPDGLPCESKGENLSVTENIPAPSPLRTYLAGAGAEGDALALSQLFSRYVACLTDGWHGNDSCHEPWNGSGGGRGRVGSGKLPIVPGGRG